MTLVPTEELSLLPIEPLETTAASMSACGSLGRARGVFGAASRFMRVVEADRPAPRGPGWFDSSWELRLGCEVREGWPPDAPLRDWIENWLRQAVVGGVSLSAT